MPTSMTYNRYYPKLNRVLNVNELPDEVPQIIKTAIQNSIGQLHYKDLQVHKNPDGSGGNWQLSIVCKKLGLELFGSGFELVINPDLDALTISSFPISMSFEWKILAILRDLNGLDFSTILTDPMLIFKIALRVFNISEKDLVAQVINVFVTPSGTNTNHLQQFVDDINTVTTGDLSSLIPGIDDQISVDTVLKDIYAITNEFNSVLIFTKYLLGSTIEESKANLERFFKGIFPYASLENYIKKIVTPQFEIKLHNLSLGLAFPRSILVPLDQITNAVLSEPAKSYLSFDVGEFSYSLNKGFNYKKEQSLNLTKSRIGNTPLFLEATGIKLDLKDGSNIPEADADGRSNAFKGVFIKEATIGILLDTDKFPQGTSISLYTKNLLVGNEGGISGTIGLTTSYETIPHHWSQLIIGSTSDITYDAKTNKLSISGGRRVDVNTTTVVPEPIPETVIMDSGGVMNIRSSEGNYFNVTVNNGVATVTAQPTPTPSPLSIQFGGDSGNQIRLDKFSVTFRQNNIVASEIVGRLLLPSKGLDLSITVDISNGFHVSFEATPGFEVTNNSIFGLTVDLFQIENTDEFFQIALGDLDPAKPGATLTSNVDIPFANKYVPRTFQIDYLAWKKYKDGYGSGADDKGFNYDILLTWDNGLSLPVSNIGGTNLPSFRKRFKIDKSKEDGFFQLEAIELVIEPNGSEGMSAGVEFYGAQFNLGKAISFTIDGLGLMTTFEKSDMGGNVGPFDVDFKVIGPKGIGVKVNAGAVKGTGYLYIDESEYRGLVQLGVSEKFSITAIAILNTKMPDGTKGNSFITIVSITGLNIQLGMGFVLDGLGGVLGIHRTMDTQFLRDNIRNGTMDSLMFPDLDNTPLSTVISDLGSVYPMKRDQFIFGPMAKIFWGGVKAIVEADLALLIEFSDPTRLIILGKAGIAIGADNFDILTLNIGVLIELNFTEKRLMMDASIYDSKLLAFNLEGDMALRLFWGDDKAFLLTVGGFHPDFTPPANLLVNNVRRMRISLLSGNPRLTVDSYFAVTSNTVQFGSAVDFYFKVSKFSVKGGFGFDCLFQFNPFQFTISVHAYLGVFKGSKELMGISLNGTLKGPTPWSISGKVKFKVLFIKISKRIDKTWGDSKNTSLPSIAVLPLVEEALLDDKNWEAKLPDSNYFIVSLNDNSKVAEDGSGNVQLLMNPMSTLTIKQDVVPLGVKLQQYYNQQVSGVDQFDIASVQLGQDGDPDTIVYSNLTQTKTDFAPAQYFNYTDKQKLQKNSFETMRNGVRLTASGDMDLQHFVEMDYDYDITLFDGPPEPDTLLWTKFRKEVNAANFMAVNELVKGGFISKNAQSKRNRFNTEKIVGNVQSTADDFVIVNKSTFAAHDGDEVTYSAENRSSAEDLMRVVMDGNPDLDGELMVVQKHEII